MTSDTKNNHAISDDNTLKSMKANLKHSRSGKMIIMLSFSVALLVYVAIRAHNLSFTHDESLTFTIVEGHYIYLNTANNHILNTDLMSLSESVFGKSEIALRLPNVLSFIFFLIGSFSIFKSAQNNWILLFGASLILLNPFVIEFFSLARGYGLALGFMVMSIFYMTRNGMTYHSLKPLVKDFVLSASFASLAVYSNLSMINFLISVIIIFIIQFGLFRKYQVSHLGHLAVFISVILLSCVPIYLGVQRLLLLKEMGQLYFGTTSLIDSINSLIVPTVFFTEGVPVITSLIKIVVLLFLGMGILAIIINKEFKGKLFLITILILLLTTALLLERFLFEVKYPIGRAALYYWPIFSIFTYYLAIHLFRHYENFRNVHIPIILCLMLPIWLNFFKGANLTHTRIWHYDANTKDIMEILRDTSQTMGTNVTISNHWLFEPTINYYRVLWSLNMDPANRNGIDLNSDFIYDFKEDINYDNFDVVKEYEKPKRRLLIKSNTKNIY